MGSVAYNYGSDGPIFLTKMSLTTTLLIHIFSPIVVFGYLSAPDYTVKEHKKLGPDTPKCAWNYKHLHGNATFLCLDDDEYPVFDVENAIFYHYFSIASMYKDVQLETQNSVSRIRSEREETYLCSSSVQYVKPVRAINSKGEWRIVLNYLKAKNDFIAQTVRIELCDHPGEKCPKIPGCVWTKCVQKHTYHRLLVYNPSDYYLPFKIESFKIPSSCDCYTAQSHEL